jgi:tape measure domain-containing protein
MSQVTVEIGADAAAFQRTVNGLPQSVNRVAGQMQAAFAGIGFAVLAKQALETVTSMDRLRRGMTTLEGSAQGAEARLRELQEAAQLPGVDFEQAVKADIKLRSVGMSAEMSKASIIEMGNALSLAGGTSADLEGVVLALTQIISKGKVSAEEINQIAERVPQVRAVMKDVFGTADTEALQKMKIDAEDFVNALIGGFSSLDRATAGLDEKMSDFRTAIMLATDALLSGLVGEGVNGLSSFAQTVNENIDLIREMGEVLRGIGALIRDTFNAAQPSMRSFGEGIGQIIGTGALMAQGKSFDEAMVEMDQAMERVREKEKLFGRWSSNIQETSQGLRQMVPGDPFGTGFLPMGENNPFAGIRGGPTTSRAPGTKFTPPSTAGGSGFFGQVAGIMGEFSRLMEPAAKAMANVLMEQSKGLQSRASALGEAAFSPLRGDVDTSFGRGRSVNPLTNGASRQISEMMKQSAILEKQAAKLDTSNATLKSIESALKAQRFTYN